MRDSAEQILWLGSWERSGTAWMIRASCLRAGKVVEAMVPAETLYQPRAYDIDAMTKLGCESLSLGVDIDDVASLSPLVDPTEVLEQLHPRLQCSAHAIYVGYAGEVPIYFPAALLIRTLWLWSDWVLPALMTPNSLSLFLGTTATEPPKRVVQAIGGLSYSRSTETHLRRVAWLGLDAKAVLTTIQVKRVANFLKASCEKSPNNSDCPKLGQWLDILSRELGFRDWNTTSASLNEAPVLTKAQKHWTNSHSTFLGVARVLIAGEKPTHHLSYSVNREFTRHDVATDLAKKLRSRIALRQLSHRFQYSQSLRLCALDAVILASDP